MPTLMSIKQERLTGKAMIKGTMLLAHLRWAHKQLGDVSRVEAHVDPEMQAVSGGASRAG